MRKFIKENKRVCAIAGILLVIMLVFGGHRLIEGLSQNLLSEIIWLLIAAACYAGMKILQKKGDKK